MYSLDEVQGALITYTQLQTEQVEAEAGQPVNQLLVRLGPEDYVLRLFCANEVLEGGSDESSSVFYFVLRYPDEIPAPFQQELTRLLSVLNHLLPLGALELHPEDGLFFRHMLLTDEPSLDGLLALDIILALQALLPRVFDWVREVLAHVGPGEIQEQLREQFRGLLQHTPVLESLAATPAPAAEPSPQPLPNRLLYGLALVLMLLSACLAGLAFGPGFGLVTAAAVALASAGLLWLYSRRRSRWRDLREQQRQLRFYWQLLEVESIKLAHQDQSLDQQQQQVEHKLAELEQAPIAYPSDILRLRTQMRALRQLQARLGQRAQQLRQRRHELEQSRFQLLRERLSLLPEAEPVESDLRQLDQGFSSEDMLIQNLVVTLEYLDFQVRSADTRDGAPMVLVSPRAGAPAIAIRWLQRWHLASEAPQHSWMLCFDLPLPVTIPQAAWPRVHELLRVFNRFLPLGALICDYAHNQISLRYRFVRLRGDLSTLLVMEILEVMTTFGERLQQRLLECVDQRKQLETILAETEQDFQTLQL